MNFNDWFQQAKKPSYWITQDSPKDAFYLGKLVYGALIFLLLYRWYAGKFLMDIALSPVINPEVDNTFWLVLTSGIPELIINNPTLCIIIDVIILALACLGFIRQDKVKITWIFLVLFFIQTITVETYTSSHSKTVVAILLTVLPFGFRGQYWLRLWELARYVLAYIMVNSAVAKIYFGGLFLKNQMTNILWEQHTDLLILQPYSWQTKFIRFLLNHTIFTNGIYYSAVLLQFVFIVAFFTKKYDKILAIFLIGFVLGTHIMMRIYNLDLLFLILPLWFSAAYFSPIGKVTFNHTTPNEPRFVFKTFRINY
ncbi:MAG TPA: hypothetical protein VLZ75_08795 [Chitinophagales bacterium]|nr:hypothetical protein [Chitinophagales bacterium]